MEGLHPLQEALKNIHKLERKWNGDVENGNDTRHYKTNTKEWASM
jgi:hypothetical protein